MKMKAIKTALTDEALKTRTKENEENTHKRKDRPHSKTGSMNTIKMSVLSRAMSKAYKK